MSATPKQKSFEELAEYARQRAEKSCARNDPVAWAYWLETARWAEQMPKRLPRRHPVEVAEEVLAATQALVNWENAADMPNQVARAYSRMKWCNAILRANGVRPMKLSLDWMRKVQEREFEICTE